MNSLFKTLVIVNLFLSFIPFNKISAQTQKEEFVIDSLPWNEITQIIQTNDGGYAVTGVTFFALDSAKCFVMKMDSSFQITWSKIIGGIGYSFEEGTDIIQTKDNGYAICGLTSTLGVGDSNVLVIKLDSIGNVKWIRTVGGSGADGANSILQTEDSSYVLSGWTSSFGAGNYDVYVIKLDKNGNLIWTKTIGGTGVDYGYAMTESPDKGYAICGYTSSFHAGDTNVYVIKLDSSGNLKWTRTVGGNHFDYGGSIVNAWDGGYVIAGGTSSFGAGNFDFYVLKLDSIGNLLWTKTIGGRYSDEGSYIIKTKDGGYAITGITESYGDRTGDEYSMKLDVNGNLQWTQATGGLREDWGGSILQTKTGGYVIGGMTESYNSLSHYQSFIVTLDSMGNSSCPDSTGGAVGSGGIVDSGGIVGSGGRVDSGGIVGSGGSIRLVCSITGQNEIKTAYPKFSLFPNPVSNYLTINFDNSFTSHTSTLSIQITDVTGRILMVYNNILLMKDDYTIDVSKLKTGMYFITITTKQTIQTLKFIKD